MPKYPLTTLESIRTGVKINLSLMDVDDYDYAIDYYIKDGVSELEKYGAILYTQKRASITLVDGKAELPEDFMSFIGLYNGNFKYWIMDVQYVNACGCYGTYIDYSGVVTIDNCCIDTNSNYDGESCLIYKAYNTGADGSKMIPKYSERALRNYASAEFGATRSTMYTPNQVASWKRDWVAQKPHIKGMVWQDYFEEHKMAIKEWTNSILPNQSQFGNISTFGVS